MPKIYLFFAWNFHPRRLPNFHRLPIQGSNLCIFIYFSFSFFFFFTYLIFFGGGGFDGLLTLWGNPFKLTSWDYFKHNFESNVKGFKFKF